MREYGGIISQAFPGGDTCDDFFWETRGLLFVSGFSNVGARSPSYQEFLLGSMGQATPTTPTFQKWTKWGKNTNQKKRG